MTRDRWREISALIEQDIMDGVMEPGTKLPTEPELARIYQAGRHSVRRAVTELGKAGYLSVEQGRGTFVQARPMIDYAIKRRTRLRGNLDPKGIAVSGETLDYARIPAPPRVARALQLAPGAEVLATSRRSMADGVPVNIGQIYHDPARFPDYPQRRLAMGSTTAVYQSYGVQDYLRAETRIHARPARGEEPRLLQQHPDMPVMVVRAVDALPDGTPIAHSEVIWSAARVKFSINFDEDDS
ncbi:phosphonate metabolism transcriptional regulator PhnF [Pseudooceanicola sp. HF7]|uniref:phosphonate metabolism transcriptional regulator PhnF n=1 Tax=Pseudooceanicola sp. HF7 TaxID=2721560 RepID=UPI0014311565|nr:phosphonate metabolism transcriptional regulator PhnF [Pseudooceanicola sp. HF7]NIZ10038.1 phosphonate metabolism transcriptional regulator PhnF [Pseudooceanicola sp. HF7]